MGGIKCHSHDLPSICCTASNTVFCSSAIDVEHGLAVIRGRTKVLCIQYRYINYRRDCNDVVKAQNIQMD